MGTIFDTYERKYKKEDRILFQAVLNLKEGNKQSFEQVYKLSEKYIYSIIFKIVHDNDKTADLMQDTYLQIHNKLHTLENVETFLIWAGRIATNMTLRYIQKNNKETLLLEEESEFIFERPSDDKEEFLPEDILLKKERQQKLNKIINTLSMEQKITIQYYYYEELSVSEISEIMQCSPGTVKSRLNYARKQIKKAVLDTEKKEGIKLYSLSAFPLFWLLFRDEITSCAIPKAISTFVARGLSETLGINITTVGKIGLNGALQKFFASTGGKVISGAMAVSIGGAIILSQIPKTLYITSGSICYFDRYSEDSENRYTIDGKYFIVENDDKQKGVYTLNGKEILPTKFDDITYNEETCGLFKVECNYKEAYYNKSGKMICNNMYDEVSNVVDGIFYCKDGDHYRIYSTNGQIVDSTFDGIGEMINELVVVKKDNNYGVLRKDGNFIVEIKNDHIYNEIYLGDGEYITLNELTENGIRRTVLDASGGIIFTEDCTKNKYLPLYFSSGFYNGVAELSGFEDFLNPIYMPVKVDGTIIFNSIGTNYVGYNFNLYSNGFFSYYNEENKKYMLFNSQGDPIISYDYFNDKYKYVNENLIIIEDNLQEILINQEGNILLSGYDKIQYLYSGKYYLCLDDNGYDLYKDDGSILYADGFSINSIGCEIFECHSEIENKTTVVNGRDGTSFILLPEESIISEYSDGYAIKLTKVQEPEDGESYTRYEIINTYGKSKYTIHEPKEGYIDNVIVLKKGVYSYRYEDKYYIKSW